MKKLHYEVISLVHSRKGQIGTLIKSDQELVGAKVVLRFDDENEFSFFPVEIARRYKVMND